MAAPRSPVSAGSSPPSPAEASLSLWPRACLLGRCDKTPYAVSVTILRSLRWIGLSLSLGLGCCGFACTSMLGIDGTYELGSTGQTGGAKGTGAASNGGSLTGGAGGATGGTGGTAAAGMSGAGNVGTDGGIGCGTACPSGTKCCSAPGQPGTCVSPAPLVGCDLSGCTPCPPPPTNGIAVCNGTTCAIQCNNGYVLDGGQCDPLSTGGTTGAGGTTSTGGTTTTCDPSSCPQCVPLGIATCCKSDHTCGCTWAPGAVCY